MELQKRSLQVGAAALICALGLRLGGALSGPLTGFLCRPETVSALLFLETGRVVRTPSPQEPMTTMPVSEETVPETTPTVETTPPVVQAVFSPSDNNLIKINDTAKVEPPVETLLQQPLSWDLTGDEPTVLILHTHGTESYVNSEGYDQSSLYHTYDADYNMISVGKALADALTAEGISVIHDTTPHDKASYNDAYSNARASMESYLAAYPSIQLVLDLHRDSVQDGNGQQVAATVSTDAGESARLMLVMGADTGSGRHPDWEQNMALAVKLQAALERQCAGICRPIYVRSERFNQDLSAGALLIEVGSAGNTRQQALTATQVLSRAILELANGAVYRQ